jgi:hypothetical protein
MLALESAGPIATIRAMKFFETKRLTDYASCAG